MLARALPETSCKLSLGGAGRCLHSCLFAAALALMTRGAEGTCLDGLCADPNSVDVPDVDSLLQVSYRLDAAQHVHVDHHTSGDAGFKSKGIEDIIEKMVKTSPDSKVPFPCTSHPSLCAAPFNCHMLTWGELASIAKTPVGDNSDDGGNPRAFCASPVYEPYVATCLAGDVEKAGVIQFNRTLWGYYGPDTMNMDASYCFQMGFCELEKVTNETTLAEADKLCDERFGHDNWANAMAEHGAIMEKYKAYNVPKYGFHHKAISNSFAKLACAMGNFHCDVMYCKVGYCKDPHFMHKFGNMRPASYEEAKYYEGPILGNGFQPVATPS